VFVRKISNRDEHTGSDTAKHEAATNQLLLSTKELFCCWILM